MYRYPEIIDYDAYTRKNPNGRGRCLSCWHSYSEMNLKVIVLSLSNPGNIVICKGCLLNFSIHLNEVLGFTTEINNPECGIFDTLPPQVFRYIKSGQKIKAIKTLRELAGFMPDDGNPSHYYDDEQTSLKPKLMLKEAKEIVDAAEDKYYKLTDKMIN